MNPIYPTIAAILSFGAATLAQTPQPRPLPRPIPAQAAWQPAGTTDVAPHAHAHPAAPATPVVTATPAVLTPETAVERALELNPVLRLAERRIEQAELRVRTAGIRANPELGLSFRSDLIGDQNSEHMLDLELRQSFPMTDRLQKEKDLRRVQVDLARAELGEAKHALASKVRQAVLEHAIEAKQQTLFRIQRSINQEVLDFLEAQRETGEISPLDINHAQLEARKLEREQRALELGLEQSLAVLKRHIGMQPGAPLRINADLSLPAELPFGHNHSATAPQIHPELQLARQRITAAKAGVALQRSKKYQDLSLGVSLGQDKTVDAPGGLDRNAFLGFGVSVPLPLRRQNQSQLADAEGAVRMAETELMVLEKELAHARSIARLRMQNAFLLARETNGGIIDLAEKNLKEVQEAHASGLATFVQVQGAQESLVGVLRAALDASADYHRAESAYRNTIHLGRHP